MDYRSKKPRQGRTTLDSGGGNRCNVAPSPPVGSSFWGDIDKPPTPTAAGVRSFRLVSTASITPSIKSEDEGGSPAPRRSLVGSPRVVSVRGRAARSTSRTARRNRDDTIQDTDAGEGSRTPTDRGSRSTDVYDSDFTSDYVPSKDGRNTREPEGRRTTSETESEEDTLWDDSTSNDNNTEDDDDSFDDTIIVADAPSQNPYQDEEENTVRCVACVWWGLDRASCDGKQPCNECRMAWGKTGRRWECIYAPGFVRPRGRIPPMYLRIRDHHSVLHDRETRKENNPNASWTPRDIPRYGSPSPGVTSSVPRTDPPTNEIVRGGSDAAGMHWRFVRCKYGLPRLRDILIYIFDYNLQCRSVEFLQDTREVDKFFNKEQQVKHGYRVYAPQKIEMGIFQCWTAVRHWPRDKFPLVCLLLKAGVIKIRKATEPAPPVEDREFDTAYWTKTLDRTLRDGDDGWSDELGRPTFLHFKQTSGLGRPPRGDQNQQTPQSLSSTPIRKASLRGTTAHGATEKRNLPHSLERGPENESHSDISDTPIRSQRERKKQRRNDLASPTLTPMGVDTSSSHGSDLRGTMPTPARSAPTVTYFPSQQDQATSSSSAMPLRNSTIYGSVREMRDNLRKRKKQLQAIAKLQNDSLDATVLTQLSGLNYLLNDPSIKKFVKDEGKIEKMKLDVDLKGTLLADNLRGFLNLQIVKDWLNNVERPAPSN